MGIAMPKTLDIPNIEEIETLEDIKSWLRRFSELMLMVYEHSKADIRVLDTELGDSETDNSWRFKVVGGTLEVQKRIAGTWVKIGTWSE